MARMSAPHTGPTCVSCGVDECKELTSTLLVPCANSRTSATLLHNVCSLGAVELAVQWTRNSFGLPEEQFPPVEMHTPGDESAAMKCEWNAQQLDPSTRTSSLPFTELDRGMRPVWEMFMQQEHLAIARRAYELFEARGCEHGRDWEDWFRAELELHLNE